jgi:hypothetical protein
MSPKLAILVAAVVAFTSPVLAQGGAGGAGSGAAGGGASLAAPAPTAHRQDRREVKTISKGQMGTLRPLPLITLSPRKYATIRPFLRRSQRTGRWRRSCRNGVPIGEPGAGPGSPEQPIDGRNRTPR